VAQEYKVLGQSPPAATTLTDVYTVPASTSAVISSICVCNRAATGKTFRLSIAIAGAADTVAQYLTYDQAISANDMIFLQLGITLATTDVLRVYVSSADISVNVFGMEIT